MHVCDQKKKTKKKKTKKKPRMFSDKRPVCKTRVGLKSIGSHTKGDTCWSHLLSAVQVHTTTCSFYR